MPARSFLRLPIADNMNKRLKSSGALDQDTLDKVAKTGETTPFLKIIGIIAEGIVADGFSSGGFGKWALWKNGYQNNTGNILVDTGQLRNAVTSEVVE